MSLQCAVNPFSVCCAERLLVRPETGRLACRHHPHPARPMREPAVFAAGILAA